MQENEISLPPTNVKAEQLLLGAILNNQSQFEKIVVFLENEHFSEPVHQRIYAAIREDFQAGKTISPILLKSRFDADGSLKEIGGHEYLSRLMGYGVSVFKQKDYAVEIYDLAKKREMLDLCEEIKAIIHGDHDLSSDEIVTSMTSKMTQLSHNPGKSSLKTSKQVAMEIYEDLKLDAPCYSTGIVDLDESMQGGLYAKKSYGFAARKKQGKTILASTISHNLNYAGIKHLFVCAEMGRKEIHQRNLSRVIKRNSISFVKEERGTHEFLSDVAQAARNDPGNAFFLDAPGISFDDLRSQLASAVMHQKIQGVIIDYWQLVGGKRKGASTAEHQDEVAQWISNFCRENNLFSVVMAQMNKEDNTRGSEGIRLAFDQVYHLKRIDDTDYAWLEMIDTRYTIWRDVGSDVAPTVRMNKIGPYFSDM